MTALDFYKNRLKDRGFSDKQIKDLTDHKDLPWLQFAEDYFKYKNLKTIKIMETPYLDEMINELEGYIGANDNYLSKKGNAKLTELKSIKNQLILKID